MALSNKQGLGIVTFFLCVLGILYLHSHFGKDLCPRLDPKSQVEVLLNAGKFDEVQHRLDYIKMRAYCHNLVGHRDLYKHGVEEHKGMMHLFHEALGRAIENNPRDKPWPAHFEYEMALVPNRIADMNRLVFLGYPDPWKHCRQYGVFS